jgi:hypothetical protein
MAISPKPLVVIFFRAPGGRGIYKKPLEPTQRPTNPLVAEYIWIAQTLLHLRP